MHTAIFLAVFSLLASASPAPKAMLFGLAKDGTAYKLPAKLCAQPSKTIRFVADTVNGNDERRYDDLGVFRWLLYRDDSWTYWDPTSASASPTFSPGPEKNSVYVKLPFELRGHPRLSIKAYTPVVYQIELIDPASGETCTPGDPSIYVD